MKTIPLPVALRIARNLTARLGAPETSAGSDLGVWSTEAAWRFRRDDGSAWARLGFGPTRKMVVLGFRADAPDTASLSVYQS